MKRMFAQLACLLAFALALPAQADGRGYGGHVGGVWHGNHGVSQHFGAHQGGHGYGGHGGGYGGHAYRNHYRGYSQHWVAPILGAALVGSVIYSASSPSYVMPQQVVVQPYVAPPSRVAYFCPSAQQFYPQVATCLVPWQPTHY
jgi:hypothetical protein